MQLYRQYQLISVWHALHVFRYYSDFSIFCPIDSRYLRISPLTTVSKPACRRFLQLIHVKGAAVLNFNVVFPPTTIVWPMIANCTSHFTVCNRRMLSFDPSWSMRTTTTHRWTWSGHLWVTSNTSKAIPARGDVSLITTDWLLSSERFEAVGCIEVLVVAARVKSCSNFIVILIHRLRKKYCACTCTKLSQNWRLSLKHYRLKFDSVQCL